MFKRLRAHFQPEPQVSRLYAAIVAAARQPELYQVGRVPDTVDGRFDMVAAHMAPVVHQLSRLGPEGDARARVLGEAFVTDMDDNMREIGIGDLTVPRRVKKAAASVFDRFKALDVVLAAETEAQVALAGDLIGHDYPGADGIDRVAVGRYLLAYVAALAELDAAVLLSDTDAVPLIAAAQLG